MKVKELIEELKNFDPNAEVHFTYNYGDHWRTPVAPAVENVDEYQVKHSSYHDMPKIVEDDEVDDDAPYVVVLSAR